MENKFDWSEFVNVCCDRENKLNEKVRNLAVEPEVSKTYLDAKKLAIRRNAIEMSGEKINLEGGLF